MARIRRYLNPRVTAYAQVDVPRRQTIIRRNRVDLFLTVTPGGDHSIAFGHPVKTGDSFHYDEPPAK